MEEVECLVTITAFIRHEFDEPAHWMCVKRDLLTHFRLLPSAGQIRDDCFFNLLSPVTKLHLLSAHFDFDDRGEPLTRFYVSFSNWWPEVTRGTVGADVCYTMTFCKSAGNYIRAHTHTHALVHTSELARTFQCPAVVGRCGLVTSCCQDGLSGCGQCEFGNTSDRAKGLTSRTDFAWYWAHWQLLDRHWGMARKRKMDTAWTGRFGCNGTSCMFPPPRARKWFKVDRSFHGGLRKALYWFIPKSH